MSTINIIRSLLELFMICGVTYLIYKLTVLQEAAQKEADKPVQFNARDFFSVDID